jgi:hypothetical protein
MSKQIVTFLLKTGHIINLTRKQIANNLLTIRLCKFANFGRINRCKKLIESKLTDLKFNKISR